MNRSFALHFVLSVALFLSAGRAFGSPVPHQPRIPQTIIVNGQQAEGVTVTQNGLALPFNCPSPQPYTAVDQSSGGWACFDANTGSWLLNAMPPASLNVFTRPPYGYAAPYDQYNPDYTCSPEGSFCGRTGDGHTSHEGGHTAPYDQYIYAYPDYTYYPEGFFGGQTGQGHGGHYGGHHR